MKTNFFNALKEGSLELTRDQLKTVNGGNSPFISRASVTIACGGGTLTCSGTDCTGKDNVGCSCDNGQISKPCKQEQ